MSIKWAACQIKAFNEKQLTHYFRLSNSDWIIIVNKSKSCFPLKVDGLTENFNSRVAWI